MLSLDPSTSIGGYQITNTIGAGGMGVVYLAHHELLKRKAALKVLLPEYSHDQEIVSRFFKEARASTAIRHPGIVKVYDFGYQQDGSAFIAMEYLDGEALDSRLRRLGPMPVLQALRFAGQIASALAAAHDHGIVHRDLKPANVFIVPDPQVAGGERIKLLDFGIAKFAAQDGDDGTSNHTRAGAIMGSPLYMSPEQCRGLPGVDGRADLYSVGCMLLEMLTGRPPFDGGGVGVVAIMSAQLNDPPPVPSALRPDIVPELDALILYLLAKDPALRYQSAAALGHALAAISGEQASFSSLPGVLPGSSPDWLAGATVPGGVALNPTGQPLSASQIAGLRGLTYPGPSAAATVPGHRRPDASAPSQRRAAIIAVLALLAVATTIGAVSIGTAPGAPLRDVVAPLLAIRIHRAPAPAPAPGPRPRKARTFQALLETSRRRPSPTRVEPTAVVDVSAAPVDDAIAPVTIAWPPRSFSDLFSPSYLTGLLGAVRGAFEPAPRAVTWRIASAPPGAQLFDGGQPLEGGVTPFEAHFDETPGFVSLTLHLDGYQDAVLELDSEHDFDQTIALVPSVAVTIESRPPGAELVDASGASRGVTPAVVTLAQGAAPVAFTLRRDGYQELPVTVVPDRVHAERFALQATVVIHLESTPVGATVLKDGVVLGVTPLDDRFGESKGRLEYLLRLDGYREASVRLRGDHGASRAVTLRAVPAPAEPAAASATPAAKKPRRPCKEKPAVDDGGARPSIVNPYAPC